MTSRCRVDTCRPDADPRIILDGAYCCPQCTARITGWLRDLPADYASLTDALSGHRGHEPRVAGTASPPLPINAAVADLRAEVVDWLAGEVRMWRDELHLTSWPEHDTVTSMCRWLAVHARRARWREWIPTSHDALRSLRGRTRALVDLPRDRARITVGPCPEHVDGAPCPGQVTAYLPVDHDDPALMACGACGRQWETREWLRAGARILKVRRAG